MKKIEALESRRGPRREKKKDKKMHFELRSLFFFLIFVDYSFSFALQR
jgi:hypothetical protein